MKLDVNYAEGQFKIAVDFQPSDYQGMSDEILAAYLKMAQDETARRAELKEPKQHNVAKQVKSLKGGKKPKSNG